MSASLGSSRAEARISKNFVGDTKNAFELGPYDHYGTFAWGALRDAFAHWKDIDHRDSRRDALDRLLAAAV